MTIRFTVLILMFCLLACTENRKEEKRDYTKLSNQLNEDSLQVLKGILNINSKGDFVFDDLKYRDEWQRKTHLIPCNENLNEYVLRTYDSYLYLKSFDEKYWVSIEGNYLDYDTLDPAPEFVFSFISLIDEMEALTDSSQALRQMVKEKIKNDHTTQNEPH